MVFCSSWVDFTQVGRLHAECVCPCGGLTLRGLGWRQVPIFNLSLAPTPSANVRASTLPFPTFSLHPHRPHTSAHLTRAHAHRPFSPPISNFSLHPHRPHRSAHPRSLMPTGPSPRKFPTFSLQPNCRHTSAHPRSLMPVLLPTHLTFPLHPHRLQKTSAHPRSLMPIGPSPDLFPTFPLHPTVRTRRRTRAR